MLLDPHLGTVQPFTTFYIVLTLVGWWAGWGPAVLTLLLSYLLSCWFFIPPKYEFRFSSPPDFVHALTYLFVGGTIVLLMQSLRRARARDRRWAEEVLEKQAKLEAEVLQRKEADAALARSHSALERLVQERTVQLNDALEELKDFSTTITHELRTPLRAARSFLALVEERLGRGDCQEVATDVSRVSAALQRMDRLIENAILYARAGRGQWPLSPVDPAPLLRKIVQDRPELQAPRADVQIAMGELSVAGNETLLTQCFENLLDNAAKFVPAGTVPRVRVLAEARGNSVRIWVQDNGIGIPGEVQGKIFQVFERLHREDEYAGVGIGLAIVRKSVRHMGGDVGVESEPGQGSRFWVDLPRAAS
jgi:signal transduction histidine kinase